MLTDTDYRLIAMSDAQMDLFASAMAAADIRGDR